jgi:heme A synthase
MCLTVTLALVTAHQWPSAVAPSPHSGARSLRRLALITIAAIYVQILLGAETVWSGRSVIPTTLHVAVGALTLAMSLIITLMSYRVLTQPRTGQETGASRSRQHSDPGAALDRNGSPLQRSSVSL